MDWQSGLAGQRVFVTGGGGFIGRRLVAELVSAGAKVTALSRTSRPGAGGATAVRGGLKDADLLCEALKGHDVLFHLAYDVRASAAENLEGFEALMGEAERAGVGRVVHTSSIVVYNDWPEQDVTEASAMDRPGGSPYRQAKIEMERQLLGSSLPVAILQPTIVWGPGSALWTDGLAESLAGGAVILPEPEGVLNGVYVDDVVQAMLRAALVEDLGRERFIVNGPTGQRWSDLLGAYAQAIGKGSVRHEPLAAIEGRIGPKPEEGGDAGPSAAAKVSALARSIIGRERFEALVRMIKRRLAKGGDMYPDHHLLEVFAGSGWCSTQAAQSRLGYEPACDIAAGMEETGPYLKRRLG